MKIMMLCYICLVHQKSELYVVYDVPGLAVAEVIDSDKVYFYTSNPNDDSSNFCPLVPFAVML